MTEQPPPLGDLRNRLKASLEGAHISPEEMADRLAITPGIVHAWLDGRGRLKPLHMMMWASACDVPLEWLAGTEDGSAVAPAEADVPSPTAREHGDASPARSAEAGRHGRSFRG